MDEVWTLLEREYDQVLELNNVILIELMQFMVSEEAKIEGQQFTELQRKWTQVVEDLREMNGLRCLDNSIIIQSVLSELTNKECLTCYIMSTFMVEEEGELQWEIGLIGTGCSVSTLTEPNRLVRCYSCGGGHREIMCTRGRSSAFGGRSPHPTKGIQPKPSITYKH